MLEHISFEGAVPPPRNSASRPGLRANLSRFPQPGVCLTRPEPEPVPPPDPFVSWLLDRVGLDPDAYRTVPMRRRVPACLRQLRVNSGEAARRLLEKRPELLSRVMDTVLIGVTEFFRDRAVFDHLRNDLLPELLARRGGLRVYSAGTSEGHELYSVALLLAEAGAFERSYLFGTDVRPEAIQQAAGGLYRLEEITLPDNAWRERYFQTEGSWARVRSQLRDRMHWRVQDLLNYSDLEPWDVILFRNVAIYFNASHAAAAWKTLAAQLRSGGLLITGKAERPPEDLPLIRIAHCIYRKLEG